MLFTRLVALGIFVLSMAPYTAQGGIVVSEWAFLNRVETHVLPVVTRDESFWTTIQNPLDLNQNNSVGDSNSLMSYQLAWSGDTGGFLIQGTQIAIHPTASDVLTWAQGGIMFTNTVDLVTTLTLRYTYDLPGYAQTAVAELAVFDQTTNESFGHFGINVISAPFPLSGTLDQTFQTIVPAGCDCALSYDFLLETSATSVAATDSILAELDFAPVPEPAAIMLVLLGVPRISRGGRPQYRNFRPFISALGI